MRERGFSLIEVLVVTAVFIVVSGAVFMLLNVSQQRYKMESEFLDSFQGARLGLDQIIRDVHTTGYPPVASLPAAISGASPNLVAFPFSWAPNYPTTPCGVPGCTIPAAFDMIMESDLDPENANGVEWIRYRLNRTTLERGVATKTVGGNPLTATAAVMVPFVEDVMNNAGAGMMTRIRNSYSTMFPSNTPVPLFQYLCGVPAVACNASHMPNDIREVNVTLIVAAPNPDPKTGQIRVVTLTGLARRINP